MVKIGDEAPNFEYMDRDGNTKQFHDVPGKKIVFFFPKAFTAGCTAQSCSIQADYSQLKDHGITEIFGVSTDNEKKQKKFAEKYGLEYFLVSDAKHKISKAWGVLKNYIFVKVSDRDTFIIDEQNKITIIIKNGIMGKQTELGLGNHGTEILNALKANT